MESLKDFIVESRRPDIDWGKQDMYGVVWDKNTVADWFNDDVGADSRWVYSAWLDLSDVNERLVEEEDVACLECDGEGHIECDVCGGSGEEEEYDDNDNLQTVDCSECDGDGTIMCEYCQGSGETLEEERESWKTDFSIGNRGFPPGIVIRVGESEYDVSDGNHRTRYWRDAGYTQGAYWVYDKYLKDQNILPEI